MLQEVYIVVAAGGQISFGPGDCISAGPLTPGPLTGVAAVIVAVGGGGGGGGGMEREKGRKKVEVVEKVKQQSGSVLLWAALLCPRGGFVERGGRGGRGRELRTQLGSVFIFSSFSFSHT